MRFFYNTLPLLEAAKDPRVVSILAGGKEGPIEEDNLDLVKSFSVSASNTYPASMTSLAFEFLAAQHPSISFIHEFPGFVATPLLKNSLGSITGSILGLLISPMAISAEQSGEWNVFLSTFPSFPSKNLAGDDSTAEAKTKITVASTGVVGGGSYILNNKGQDSTNQKLMTEFREKGYPEIVWKHTLSTIDRVLSCE